MKKVLLPPMLKTGDKIGIIAPAGIVKQENVNKGIAQLKKLGFEVKYSSSLFEQTRYTAGSIKRRVAEFEEMLEDKSVKAIFAARGGYGSMHLLEYLDKLENFDPTQPKIVMGYSDITALLIGLYQKYSWVTFHGPMINKDFAEGLYDKRSFTKLLTRPLPAGPVDSQTTQILVPGTARGRLLGGCMSLIVSLLGTPWELDTTGAILFLEDINEKPYRLDRMITQLKLAGKLQNVRAIIFGEMVACQVEATANYSLTDLLTDLTKDLNIPVVFGLRAGHSDIGNLTLAFGVEVSLNERGILSFNEPAVVL
ncbi:MAG: LD-carboxypeptidase [Blastocatellia bacterium]|nr:LD-carboxypeptidase [Blastocatellia bacterium]MBL8193656.1 LD-carboxypeptidase [Blastocatellia bacterium]MBN8723327.1 LD-carboxypeptidase [Acidobacteriota bacterium]